MIGWDSILPLTHAVRSHPPPPPTHLQLKRGHALVLGAEMPSRVLRRFNAKLEAEVGGMRRRQEEKKAALQALFQESLRGEGEAEEMVQIHNEVGSGGVGVRKCAWGPQLDSFIVAASRTPTQMVACRGAIVKQRAAKAAAQAVSGVALGVDVASGGSPCCWAHAHRNNPPSPSQEVEAKRRELEELKTKSADMARRLQVR